MGYASDDQPIVPLVGETVGEDVFENHHAGKCFDGNVACETVSHGFHLGDEVVETYDEHQRHRRTLRQHQ